MVGALFLVRLGRCQYGLDTGRQCVNKTRMGVGVPVIDDEELMGCRICPGHLAVFLEALRAKLK